MNDQQRIEMTTDDHDTKDCTRLPVVAWQHWGDQTRLLCDLGKRRAIPGTVADEFTRPLTYLTDAQALIAELRAENERLKEGQEKLIFVRDDYKKQAHDYRARWASAIASGNAPAGAIEAIRAEFPLFDDAGLDQETHHCEWSVQNDRKRLHKLLAALKAQPSGVVPAALIEALKYYANGDHLLLADPDAWDTCSGEPINFLHDDAGTASVEDGSIAKAALDSLNSSPVSSGDPEKCSYQGDPRSPAELSLAGCNCVRFGEGNPHWPCKLHTPVSACGVDERAAFEAWYLGHFYMGDKQCGLEWLSTEPCGGYRHQHPAEQWIVWQARAALSPAEQPAEPFELGLCEQKHTVLQPGRLYLFTVHPDCPKCVAMAAPLASAQQQKGVES